MKPVLMRHVKAVAESFKAWKNGDPYIHNPWHFHPEYEIAYIHRGNGTLLIGDNIVEYSQNDIVLIGSNLPHEWRSSITNSPDLYSETISAHFKHNFMGDSFYDLPELLRLNNLLEKAKQGLRVTDPFTKIYIKEKLLILPETQGLKKIIKLLQILHKISESPGLTCLSSKSFTNSIDSDQCHRINRIYEYVMNNFKDQISISDVANLINMTNTSFCRFFKERANKTFITYLNEVRVSYACKLLLDGDLTISQIAYESGFGNVSNFNKQFKSLKSTTPTNFVKHYIDDRTA